MTLYGGTESGDGREVEAVSGKAKIFGKRRKKRFDKGEMEVECAPLGGKDNVSGNR